ncbi:MAG: alpha/beta hydrolase family protein, partial [Vicinamibacteria bacterium]
ACLISACAQPSGPSYLTTSEVERLVIGKGLREAGADRWKETFLPGDAGAREGRIRGRSRLSLPYTGKWSLDADRICVDYGDEGGCYRLSMSGENRIAWFDDAGSLAFESTLVEADRPEEVALPFPKESVTFRHGENTLAGDLSRPSGPAPHPAIVFVHGAGPTSRHWSGHEPIRDEFLRRGFATLIWSKPGVDESTGDYLEQSMDDRAGEVEAAMSYLATRADIDRKRIGLWGGSQAGWVVPKVAARREVAFIILVACPADDVMSQDLYVARNFLALLEISEAERAQALDEVRSFHQLMRVVLFEGADHALAQPDREGYLDYAPGFLATMGEWLSKRR